MMDDHFGTLRERFRTRAASQIVALEQALAIDDRAYIADIAHKLNGAGATFGYPLITSLAESLEDAAALVGLELDHVRQTASPLLAELRRIAQAD